MSQRFPFPRIPSGWYVVAASSEIRPGQVVTRRYFDTQLALYRTRSGALRMADAFCPHMGAHLGKVGRVEGERLRCGFHGFCYDASGMCVETSYGGPPPPRARLGLWEVCEQNGLVLAWFDPQDRAPDWQVPVLEDTDWTPMRWHRYEIATTPQETTENSVDLGHFSQLHGFVSGDTTSPIVTEGAFLTSAYRAAYPLGVPGFMRALPVDYVVKVWGLGYSQVDAAIPALGIRFRVWVLPVPVDSEHVELVLGVSTPKLPLGLGYATRLFMHGRVLHEVDQDLDIWNYKAFKPRPALAKGDGPIAEYRAWARQFYE